MLSDYPVHAVLASTDVDRARAWYSERLGLEPLRERDGQLLYGIGASVFTIYRTTFAGTAKNTVAVWGVDDLRAEVVRLRARGLVFEELDFGPDDRTVDGVMTTRLGSEIVLNAWFRDADGNWISVVQQPPEPGDQLGISPMIAAADIARARAWYADRLGLQPYHDYGEEVTYRPGLSHLSIYATPSAGTAKNTVAEWHVPDLRTTMADLRARGLEFEEYDFGTMKTVDGVMRDPEDGSLNAWFTDSEGNVHGIVEGDTRTAF